MKRLMMLFQASLKKYTSQFLWILLGISIAIFVIFLISTFDLFSMNEIKGVEFSVYVVGGVTSFDFYQIVPRLLLAIFTLYLLISPTVQTVSIFDGGIRNGVTRKDLSVFFTSYVTILFVLNTIANWLISSIEKGGWATLPEVSDLLLNLSLYLALVLILLGLYRFGAVVIIFSFGGLMIVNILVRILMGSLMRSFPGLVSFVSFITSHPIWITSIISILLYSLLLFAIQKISVQTK